MTTQRLTTQRLVTQWLVTQWLMTQRLVSQWLVSQTLVTLGHPSHPRRRQPESMNLEQLQGTSFEFLLSDNHLINSRSGLLILVKRVLDYSRHISPKIDAAPGHIHWAALFFKPRQRRVTAWDKPFDFFITQHFNALNLLPDL